MLSRVATRGGYILVNNSSVVNSILAKANHFLPRSFFRHLRSQFVMSNFLAHHSSTPYNLAKSRSRITCLPRMTWMRFSIFSKGCNGADSTFSMSFFFAIPYITIFTIRPGTTMTFLGVLPARYLDVSSCARTSFSTSSFGVSFGHSSVKRTLPLN